MIWKFIGQSVKGTSHVSQKKDCEDAHACTVVYTAEQEEVLLCCVSDGAGSALYGGWASRYITQTAILVLSDWIEKETKIAEAQIQLLAEKLYDGISEKASADEIPLNEYSATFLGAAVYPDKTIFFQIGDGAIIMNDGTDFYTPVMLPQNGEYQNMTFFLVDNPDLPALRCFVLPGQVNELALFTDGLQQLVLHMEDKTVHQPFFASMFPVLRRALTAEYINALNAKLSLYLNSDHINARTDDDKTLLLATRLPG